MPTAPSPVAVRPSRYRERFVRASSSLNIALSLAAAACSGSGGETDTGGPTENVDAGADSGRTPSAFRVAPLPGCGAAGYQTVAAVSGNKIGFATLASTDKNAACTTMNGTSEVPVWDICYAVSSGGDDFSTTVVTSQSYLAPTGVALAFDPGGEPTVAFTGGGPAKLRCGATELRLTSATGGRFGTPRTIATGSASSALVPDQAANCTQGICNSGDATGYWPALAFDSAGRPAVVFRDIHFGFASDDFASSDVEFARGNDFSLLTIDVARGGGTYLRLAFTPAGKAAVVHYSAERAPGIWFNRETVTGWESRKLTEGEIGEQLGFGINAAGLHALAYYSKPDTRLVYIESTDGAAWSSPTDVDLDGVTGQYPSLAFDADGDPGIAYYRCNRLGTSNRSCDPGQDGLYLARRKRGRFQVQSVRAEPGIFDGLYPALTFVGNKAVISYQTRFFDPASGTNTVAWWVAKEP